METREERNQMRRNTLAGVVRRLRKTYDYEKKWIKIEISNNKPYNADIFIYPSDQDDKSISLCGGVGKLLADISCGDDVELRKLNACICADEADKPYIMIF